MPHKHKAVANRSTAEFGWTGCITPDLCAAHPKRQAAHGNIIRVQVCSCGAIRHVEINGGRKNYAPWPVDEFAHEDY